MHGTGWAACKAHQKSCMPSSKKHGLPQPAGVATHCSVQGMRAGRLDQPRHHRLGQRREHVPQQRHHRLQAAGKRPSVPGHDVHKAGPRLPKKEGCMLLGPIAADMHAPAFPGPERALGGSGWCDPGLPGAAPLWHPCSPGIAAAVWVWCGSNPARGARWMPLLGPRRHAHAHAPPPQGSPHLEAAVAPVTLIFRQQLARQLHTLGEQGLQLPLRGHRFSNWARRAGPGAERCANVSKVKSLQMKRRARRKEHALAAAGAERAGRRRPTCCLMLDSQPGWDLMHFHNASLIASSIDQSSRRQPLTEHSQLYKGARRRCAIPQASEAAGPHRHCCRRCLCIVGVPPCSCCGHLLLLLPLVPRVLVPAQLLPLHGCVRLHFPITRASPHSRGSPAG